MATNQDYIQKSSDGTVVAHLEDSIIYQDDANSQIGIGTMSPGAKLELNGALKMDEVTSIGDPGTDKVSIYSAERSGAGAAGTGLFARMPDKGSTSDIRNIAAVDWINVKDFGATGNGTTDDTDEIQAAIDYARDLTIASTSDKGATVYFPAGIYLVTKTLFIGEGQVDSSSTKKQGDGIILLGASSERSVLIADRSSYSSQNLLTLTGTSSGGVVITLTSTSTGGDTTTLIHSGRNFVTEGVSVGMYLKQTSGGGNSAICIITAIGGTNNDTLNFTVVSGSPDFSGGQSYEFQSELIHSGVNFATIGVCVGMCFKQTSGAGNGALCRITAIVGTNNNTLVFTTIAGSPDFTGGQNYEFQSAVSETNTGETQITTFAATAGAAMPEVGDLVNITSIGSNFNGDYSVLSVSSRIFKAFNPNTTATNQTGTGGNFTANMHIIQIRGGQSGTAAEMTNNARIERLGFGVASNQNARHIAITILYGSNCAIHQCFISGTSSSNRFLEGIRIQSWTNTLSSCDIKMCNTGINIQDGRLINPTLDSITGNATFISGMSMFWNPTGIRIQGYPFANAIVGCTIEGEGAGTSTGVILDSNSHSNSVMNCYFENNQYPIQVKTTYNTVCGNFITSASATAPGISVDTGEGNVIIGNYFHNGASDQKQYNIFGGSVGIGTTSPASKLDVWGNITVTGSQWATPGDSAILYLGYGPYNYIKAVHSTGVQIGAYGAADAITLLNTSGYVGIGITSPAYKLDVSGGDIAIEGTGKLIFPSGGAAITNFAESYGIKYTGDTTHPFQIANGGLLVGYAASGGTCAAGSAAFAGPVGLGEISPSAKLDIVHSGTGTGSRGIEVNSGADAEDGVVIIRNGIDASKYALLVYNGANKMTVDYNGNGYYAGSLGLGITIPAYPLHLKTSNSYDHFVIENGDTGRKWSLACIDKDNYSATKDFFAISDVNGSPRITVQDDTGNVGMGTHEPKTKLDVWGNITVTGAQWATPGDTAILYLGYGTDNYIKAVYGTGVQVGAYGAADAITLLNTSGNVGIGTTSPTVKLDVNGNIKCGASDKFLIGSVEIKSGSGVPNNNDGAPKGSLYLRTDGGTSTTLYVKTGTSTWTAK